MIALDRHTIRRLHAILESVPVHIAALDQFGHFLLALEDHAKVGLVGRQFNRAIQERLVMHGPPRLDPAGGGDDRLRGGIINPDGEFGGGEAAKDHRMHRADAGTGKHRFQRLRDHGHVDDDAVAFLHPLGPQRTGQCCNPVAQLNE